MLCTPGIRKRKSAFSRVVDEQALQSQPYVEYPIQLYTTPPSRDISLEEFKELCITRRNVLKEIEYASATFLRGSQQWMGKLREICKSAKLNVESDSGSRDQEVRRRDDISHHLLRLAYCKEEHLRRWLCLQETDLFRYRLESVKEEVIQDFVKHSEEFKDFEQLSDEDYKPLEKEILASYLKANRDRIRNGKVKFFKVPFQKVSKLVANKSVLVKAGYAYIPNWETDTFITNVFRSKLSCSLTTSINRAASRVDNDDRIKDIIHNLDKEYTGPKLRSSNDNTESVFVEDIEDLCSKSFPLCMANLQHSLKIDHHLKHGGRLQYGLFLKAIGLSLEESLKLWKNEFTKTMDLDKFEKQYAYNIRHSYGKEGNKVSYSAFSCSKIINGSHPGPEDKHGCPFKHFSRPNLKSLLQHVGTKDAVIQSILELAENKQYNLACLKQFEAAHGLENTSFIMDHPNRYFRESQILLKGSVKMILNTSTINTTEGPTSSNKPQTNDSMDILMEEGLEDICTDMFDDLESYD